MQDAFPRRLLVAIGGNATHPEGIRGTAHEQTQLAAATGRSLLPLMELDGELIITHGNGPVVGKILWARSATEAEARRFVRALHGTLVVYGHDVVPEGFETTGEEQICISTSFGVYDHSKVYVSLDLAARYRGTSDLRIGTELLPLYPDKALARIGGKKNYIR